jgi:hypothetical protein
MKKTTCQVSRKNDVVCGITIRWVQKKDVEDVHCLRGFSCFFFLVEVGRNALWRRKLEL